MDICRTALARVKFDSESYTYILKRVTVLWPNKHHFSMHLFEFQTWSKNKSQVRTSGIYIVIEPIWTMFTFYCVSTSKAESLTMEPSTGSMPWLTWYFIRDYPICMLGKWKIIGLYVYTQTNHGQDPPHIKQKMCGGVIRFGLEEVLFKPGNPYSFLRVILAEIGIHF